MKKYFFKHYKKKSGTLVPFSLKANIPFQSKRIFIIYGNKNFIRGKHAHYTCSQFLVPIYGKMELLMEDINKKQKIILDHKRKRGYLLKPKTWCEIKFRSNNSILMVFCNKEYQFSDYIEKYKDFLRIIKKK